MNDLEQLGTLPIGKLLIKYSTPAIISMFVNGAYNFIDRLFVGNIEGVGTKALAGVGVSFPVLSIWMAFGFMIAAGAATNISLELGRGNREKAALVAGNALAITFLIGIALTALHFAASRKILVAFASSPESEVYALDFLNMLAIGIVPWVCALTLNFLIRADGAPRLSAAIMIVGALLNIPLAYILVYRAELGVGGAGLASTIAQTVTFIMGLCYYIKGKPNLPIPLSALKPDWSVIKMILKIGVTPFILQIAICSAIVVSNHSLKLYGEDLAISANTTIGAVIMLFLMPLFGLNQGMQPIVGYNYGAKKFDRAKKTFMLTCAAGVLLLSIAAVFTLIFPRSLILLFNDDTELLSTTMGGIRKVTMFLPTVAVSIIGANYILATGKAGLAMSLSLIRQVIVYIPALLILPRFLGLNGVWFAQPLCDILSFTAVMVVLRREFKSYSR